MVGDNERDMEGEIVGAVGSSRDGWQRDGVDMHPYRATAPGRAGTVGRFEVIRFVAGIRRRMIGAVVLMMRVLGILLLPDALMRCLACHDDIGRDTLQGNHG